MLLNLTIIFQQDFLYLVHVHVHIDHVHRPYTYIRVLELTLRNVVFPLLLTSTLSRNPVFGGDLVLADLSSAGTLGSVLYCTALYYTVHGVTSAVRGHLASVGHLLW